MAHKITKRDSLMYVGEKPWHGIGKNVGNEVVTASEALLASGLDWKVISRPVFNQQGGQIAGFNAIVREDTGEVFQIAKDRYLPVQNRDCFQVFDEVVGTGQAKYEVAGSLQGGRKVWILSRIPSCDFDVKGKDSILGYLLLTTSHDGSLSFQMYQTPVRVVCWNTLSASLSTRKKGEVAYFKHTVNFRNRVGMAKEVLAETIEYYRKFKEASEVLARKEMMQAEIDNFLAKLFKAESTGADDEVSTRKKNDLAEVQRLVVDGKGNDVDGIRGTAWAVWNGVTEFVDHHRSTRGDASNRLMSSWYGSGEKLRQEAFGGLMELATK